MRKIYRLLTVTTSVTFASSSLVACFNQPQTSPPIEAVKFSLMNGLTNVTAIAIANDNTLYAISNESYESSLYKYVDSNQQFLKLATFSEKSTSIREAKMTIDHNNNIYICKDNKIYYYQAQQAQFSLIKGYEGTISGQITHDENNNIYIGNRDGQIYQLKSGEQQFAPVKNIGSNIWVTSNRFIKGNLYTLGYDNKKQLTLLYKYTKSAKKLELIASFNNTFYSNLLLFDNNLLYCGISLNNAGTDQGGKIYQYLAPNQVQEVTSLKGIINDFTFDQNHTLYAIDNGNNIYQKLAHEKKIKIINNKIKEAGTQAIIINNDNIYVATSGGIYKNQ